jgi:hypothetical protein
VSKERRNTRKILKRGFGWVSLLAGGLAVAFIASGLASGSPGASTTTATTTTTTTAKTTTSAVQKPENTSPPSITGTPQEGQKLTADKGAWSGDPTDYDYFWVRCDKNGGSCSNISNATTASYTLTSADVGNTLRFKVQASNAGGSSAASSVPSAVIKAAASPPPPPAPTGCPAGTSSININDLKPPARLLLDGQQADPGVVHAGTSEIIIRYHVSACGGRPVQGALVYATAVPFRQLATPPEQPTGQDGWTELRFRTLAGFPVSNRQQLIALFARARKSGENLLGGISTRRLFSLRVNLRG